MECLNNWSRISVAEAHCRAIRIGKMNMSDVATSIENPLCDIRLLDVHVEEVGKKHDIRQRFSFDPLGTNLLMVDQVRLVAVQRFVNERNTMATRSFTGNTKGIRKPAQCLITRNIAAPAALHGSENRRRSKLTTELDHRLNELERCIPLRRIRIRQRKPMLHHAGSSAHSCHTESMAVAQGFHFVDPDNIRTWKEQFNVIKTCSRGFGETLIKGIMKDERTGRGLSDTAKSNGSTHQIDSSIMLPYGVASPVRISPIAEGTIFLKSL